MMNSELKDRGLQYAAQHADFLAILPKDLQGIVKTYLAIAWLDGRVAVLKESLYTRSQVSSVPAPVPLPSQSALTR